MPATSPRVLTFLTIVPVLAIPVASLFLGKTNAVGQSQRPSIDSVTGRMDLTLIEPVQDFAENQPYGGSEVLETNVTQDDSGAIRYSCVFRINDMHEDSEFVPRLEIHPLAIDPETEERSVHEEIVLNIETGPYPLAIDSGGTYTATGHFRLLPGTYKGWFLVYNGHQPDFEPELASGRSFEFTVR